MQPQQFESFGYLLLEKGWPIAVLAVLEEK